MTENYYVVLSFMVKELKLKGIEKDVYAIIYGFSQNKGKYTGSLQYLMEWTSSSKQGVLNALNKLIEKNLITKNEVYFNNVKFVEYFTTELTSGQESGLGGSNNLTRVSQESRPNNINNNKENNNINNILSEKSDYAYLRNEILNYLNDKTGKNYRDCTSNQRLIDARLKEGYKLDDFKHVIDVKCSQWLGWEEEKYLRPETLFAASHFESYLNEKIKSGLKNNPIDEPNGGFESLNDYDFTSNSEDDKEELLF